MIPRLLALILALVGLVVLWQYSSGGRLWNAVCTEVLRPITMWISKPHAEVLAALPNAQSITLYELDPALQLSSINENPATREGFYGTRIMRSRQITDRTERNMIAADLFDWMRSDSKDRVKACMFNPHHGMRVISGQHTYDWVICFECDEIMIYKYDQKGSPASEPFDTASLEDEQRRHQQTIVQILGKPQSAP